MTVIVLAFVWLLSHPWMMNAYQSAQENTVTRFDIRRLADSLKRKCRKHDSYGSQRETKFKSIA